MKEYIYKIVKSELNKRWIWASDYDIEHICGLVINQGKYAFRLIYSDVDRYDVHIKNHSFRLEEYEPIDWRLVKRDSIDSGLFSIDGGIRYQWSYFEVLFIDPSIMRDKKIEELGV